MKEIELFRFALGASAPTVTRVWTMTSALTGLTYNNEWYDPVAVGRSQMESKTQLSKANLDVDIPIDHELAVILMSAFSEQIMTLNLYQKDGSTVATAWKGRLTNIRPGDATLTLVFESVFTSLRRPGLRGRFMKSCRHPLYGRGCYVNPADFETPGTLSAVNGLVLTVAEAATQPDGYFIAGMIKAADGTYSYITAHAGDQITVQRLSYSLAKQFALGLDFSVNLYPGCDHTRLQCQEKFDNLLNYGGFDWIPEKNPMAGSSIV